MNNGDTETIDLDIDLQRSLEKNNIKSNKKVFRMVKRMFDIILSFLGIIILFPLFIIIGIIIKIESKGKVIFKHKRIGKNGKIIYIYKFRTMFDNAEYMIKDFTIEQKEEFNKNYKLKNDPRITKVGSFLRKTSLDELPQLFNIIKGDLSIIGPRPVIERELDKYGENKEKFLSVIPGLTGYWAANGRSDTSYEKRMEMELFYVDNMSLKLDLEIFLNTIKSVVSRRGAI